MKALARFLARLARKEPLRSNQGRRMLRFERLEARELLDATGGELPGDGALLEKRVDAEYPEAEYSYDRAFDREYMALTTDYLLQEYHGGTIHDAEKSPDFTDDAMCWAAAASNVLAWTGWGDVAGMITADDMFEYMGEHWNNWGGYTQYAWDWWFDGTPLIFGGSASLRDPSDPGGGFYPSEDFNDYYHWSPGGDGAMADLDEFLHAGYGTALDLHGPTGHAVTCWGFRTSTTDPGDYRGVWITDSDDNMRDTDPPDQLQYYEVEFVEYTDSGHGYWHLQDYYGDSYYIAGIRALERIPFYYLRNTTVYADIAWPGDDSTPSKDFEPFDGQMFDPGPIGPDAFFSDYQAGDDIAKHQPAMWSMKSADSAVESTVTPKSDNDDPGKPLGHVAADLFDDIEATHAVDRDRLFDGELADPRKSPANPEDDIFMSWAATPANILEWTGWPPASCS